jgi:tRNA-splicing ligase RtcB
MALDYLKARNGMLIPMWVAANEVESQALDQLRNVAELPWVVRLAAMPDIHAGKGATVGTVIGMRDAVSPSAVGVDGGCGMGVVQTNLDAGKVTRKLAKLRAEIEARIPIGFSSHTTPAYTAAPGELAREAEQLFAEFGSLTPEVQAHIDRAKHQLGTLGGGNHFIELSLDADKNVWLMLHSGSRWIGKELADTHILKAMALGHNAALPDKALAVFLADTPEMHAYWNDLTWAQQYAALNRKLMLWLYEEVLQEFWPGLQFTSEPIWCHHNYAEQEIHDGDKLYVTRKGAIRAQAGDLGIVPGAVGAPSYIVRGRGCAEALQSAPHGAGRKMSRGAAKRKFTQADIDEQTAGVECKKDKSILDELRGAYKPIKRVIANSAELVEIVVQLDPALLCVKG